jgi:predicted dehydrogenase
MRVCIVGAGEIAKVHIKGVNKIEGAQVVGILDRYFTRGEMLAEMVEEGHGNPIAYVDYDTMLKEQNPDVVHICLPPNLHFSYAEKALLSGAHILVEKPFTVTLKDADRLYEIADAKNLKICPMYNHLFDKAALEVKALVGAKTIGEVVNVESYYGFNLGGAKSKYNLKGSAHWVYDTPGGHLLNIGPHILSTMLEFIGADDVEFIPMALNRGKAREGMFDEYRVLIKNGQNTGLFTLSLNANPYFHFLNIYGTKSSIFYDIANWHFKKQALNPKLPNALARATNNLSFSWKGITSTIGATLQSLTGQLTHFDGMWELMSQFYESIDQDLPSPISKEVNLATVRGLETIENVTSLQSGSLHSGSLKAGSLQSESLQSVSSQSASV